MTPEDLIRLLKLEPLQPEGGFYRETYRSSDLLPEESLPPRYRGARSMGTAIYYVITPEHFSTLHRLQSDEVFHFYLGDPVEMLLIFADGNTETRILGQDLEKGQHLHACVPMQVWQGARLVEGGSFALLGTTVAPGFDPSDFELGDRGNLIQCFPHVAGLISIFTHP